MNNISVNLENLTDKERDTLLSLIEKANRKADNTGERWKPEEGDAYYYVDSVGMIKSDLWKDGYVHLCRYELGNVFRAGTDANLTGCKILYATKLEDFARKHNGEFTSFNYYLVPYKKEDGSCYIAIDGIQTIFHLVV